MLDPKQGADQPFLTASRAKMCLVSMCSVLNASRPEAGGDVEAAVLVDEDTPKAILDMYRANSVRLIDVSAFPFPSWFNTGTASAAFQRQTAQKSIGWAWSPRVTVAQALRQGWPHFSSVPGKRG